MQKLRFISDQFAGRAAMLAGAALAAGGVTQIVHSQRHAGSRVIGLAGHVTLAFFVAALLALAPVLVALGSRTGRQLGRRAGIAAGVGVVVLGLTSITSLVNGRDLGLFVVVAPLTNAAWLFGSIAIAFTLRRTRAVPAWVAFGLVPAYLATIPLATVGGGVLAGAYYLAFGYLLTSAAATGRTHPALASARG